ncbi:stage 0 sporulation protein [Candidatus Falkowbacteria bacterium CG11_big_fil_rev_8_21_14_0_20_39_10]|uniref:Stage 0 sporulation protein n=1 Tax=Candidatus Falkowbacteria bacterium CG11_big_fil_rev_8_21_14_0_20_39_10 TaxID=1974570 RepID=A0A2M6K8K4_9BACT|nr:MAG: stage 0 sporulation protein [Candidatus Falkowbacteria bacterium CG11_big_fil_rev_8_21_14_0_20_39_10]
MKIVRVQFTPWDKPYNFSLNNLDLVQGDMVVVKTELGTELGKILEIKDISKEELAKDGFLGGLREFSEEKDEAEEEKETTDNGQKREIKPILRKATRIDLDSLPKAEDSKKALDYCKQMIDKHELEMKLVDAHFSFDGSRLTFAFIADGRVDFRELVKDLTRNFNRTIRLHQIGIRDEAKLCGDYGHCGRVLCCRKFLKDLASITSEMAEAQQCVHRGSERISGMCGRLMCCLAYEQLGYEEMAKKMPAIGAKVNVDGKRGIVVGHHVLKQSVNVEFKGEKGDDRIVTEVDLNRKK